MHAHARVSIDGCLCACVSMGVCLCAHVCAWARVDVHLCLCVHTWTYPHTRFINDFNQIYNVNIKTRLYIFFKDTFSLNFRIIKINSKYSQ